MMCNYTNPDDATYDGKYVIGLLSVTGKGYKTIYYSQFQIQYVDSLKKENVTFAMFEYADAVKHTCEANAFGDTSFIKPIASVHGELTDAQFDDLIERSQDILKDYWRVNFADKELRNSDFMNQAFEIYYDYMQSSL
ncbi:MAG: hypothetical protein MJ060_01160 [Clostridia bacterium]|nr:hypothetical protein [Clostridia bacterium]